MAIVHDSVVVGLVGDIIFEVVTKAVEGQIVDLGKMLGIAFLI
jgi:hypothetical protein